MIAHLEGTISFRGTRCIIVNVRGVGYKVAVSLETLKQLPQKGSPAELFTHLHVREDALELYGFSTMAELEFFGMLIGISGIGPKSALGVLSVAPVDTLKRAIASGDTAYLTKISGIGRRIAEKMIVELKEKLAGSADGVAGDESANAIDALSSLGYSVKEAREALGKVPADAVSLDAKIREALKILGSSR